MNVNGALFTAEAAGHQMARFGNGRSIVLVATMSDSITNKVRPETLCQRRGHILPVARAHFAAARPSLRRWWAAHVTISFC